MGTQPTTTTPDYLAIIPIGGGSSWGRAPNKEAAIAKAIAAVRDWQELFQVSDIEVTVNVIDVHGYSTCCWDARSITGKNEATGETETIERPIEHVKRRTPKWKSKRRA